MSATALRLQIERSLEHRFPAALSPAARTLETASTDIGEVDKLLGGGLPVGAITEIVGDQSSGRTSLALAFLARQTGEGRSCAWIDAGDAFDPESAAASGVVQRQLLWVRCGGVEGPEGRSPEFSCQLTRFTAASSAPERCSSPNSPEVLPFSVSEAAPCHKASRASRVFRATGSKKPWSRLEQAIRATDLLLQAGGFAAIVLDLAGTAPEHASRIPLATWFRFRQAAARTRCLLVVLVQAACAQSSAAAVLECAPQAARDKSSTAGGGTVLDGFTFSLRRSRGDQASRTAAGAAGRKSPESAWPADCAWNAEKRA